MVTRIRIRGASVVVLGAILWVSTAHFCFSALARQYELIPGPDGLNRSRGNKWVLVKAPKGWESREQRRVGDFAVGFGLAGRRGDPVLSVWANHLSRSNTGKVTAKNSYMGENLETAITELKRISSFDARPNGPLDVWLIRTDIRNYLLVVMVQPDNEGRTEVDIYLSSKDVAQLMPYLNSLKEVARSIRVVNR
jgi:hypothetical protein